MRKGMETQNTQSEKPFPHNTATVAATMDTTEGSSVGEEKIIGDKFEDPKVLAEGNENVAGEDTLLSMVLHEIEEFRKDIWHKQQSSRQQLTVPFSSEILLTYTHFVG
jgi:hypothetical protein